jgi:hypothetical protein
MTVRAFALALIVAGLLAWFLAPHELESQAALLFVGAEGGKAALTARGHLEYATH